MSTPTPFMQIYRHPTDASVRLQIFQSGSPIHSVEVELTIEQTEHAIAALKQALSAIRRTL